jgi:CRISPR-associated protein Csd1
MLVQALTEYADTYLNDKLNDPAFEETPVPFAVQIRFDGTFAGIRERMEETRHGKKTRLQPRRLLMPRSPVNRNSIVFPLLACDGVQYVVGVGPWTPTSKEKNHRERHEAFVERLRIAAAETSDPALRACCRFYGDARAVAAARDALAERMKKEGNVALEVLPSDPAHGGGTVIEREPVRAWWRHLYDKAFGERVAGGGTAICLVTGRIGPFALTHEKVKGLASLGGQASGVSLMSFDKPAFQSYGWEKNANSPVLPDRALAYVAALNDLLVPGMHRRGASGRRVVRTRMDLGRVGFLFWTRRPTDDDWISLLSEASPDDVAALFRAPETGHAAADADPNEFYVLAVSGNGGRLLVRQWFRDTLEATRRRVREWFEGLRVADVFRGGSTAPPPPMSKLLASLAHEGGDAAPGHAIQLLRRALHGQPLGRSILAAALHRLQVIKGNKRLDPARMGLVRLCVNDLDLQGGRMTEDLNPDLAHPAYLCGRLLAVYDGLQYAAHEGKVNVTAADRYWGQASTFPQIAFPKLDGLGRAHLKKLRRDKPGAAVNIERQLRELMRQLGETFPSRLSLEDQGRFVLGYHHQKADDARRAAAAKNAKEGARQA